MVKITLKQYKGRVISWFYIYMHNKTISRLPEAAMKKCLGLSLLKKYLLIISGYKMLLYQFSQYAFLSMASEISTVHFSVCNTSHLSSLGKY